MLTTSDALKALEALLADEDGHKNWSEDDYELFAVVESYIIKTTPRELKNCGPHLGMQWCYDLGNQLIAIPAPSEVYPDAHYIFHLPSQFRVSAVRSLHEAWYFANEVGYLWDRVGTNTGSLECTVALHATWKWEHTHGLHDDGCECPYGDDEDEGSGDDEAQEVE